MLLLFIENIEETFLFFIPSMMIRKQSLVNQSSNPFVVVTQRLDQLPNNINDITRQQIVSLTEPLIGWGTPDDMMALAKTTSRILFSDMDSENRVQRINNLVNLKIQIFGQISNFFSFFKQLSKLRLALDSETTAHANLIASLQTDNINSGINSTLLSNISSPTTDIKTTQSLTSSVESTPKNVKDNPHDAARKAFLVGQSEERVQALSVIMLCLCTGLQLQITN